MPDPDTDVESDRVPDPRFDNWPVRRYDAYEEWPVERSTPAGEPERVESVEWVGFAGTSADSPLVYDTSAGVVHEARLDDERERVVLDEDSARHDVDDDSVADSLAALGDEHGWTWLSSFAREHLGADPDQDRDAASNYRIPDSLDHRYSEFQRSNVTPEDDHSAAFFGSHTFADETDRVHVLEREFAVEEGGSDDQASVHVDERYLVAEEPNAESRAGDAEIVDERAYDLSLDAAVERGRGGDAETELRTWHEAHLATPASAEANRTQEVATPN